MITISLSEKKIGFQWITSNDFWVIGYGFSSEGKFLAGHDLMKYLLSWFRDKEISANHLKSINGIFSMVCKSGNDLYLYSDKSRFFPIFFRLTPEIMVGDNPHTLIQKGDIVQEIAIEEFRYTGYTTGCETLVHEIMQVPAGELVIIGSDGSMKRQQVFSYKVKKDELQHHEDPISAMYSAIEKAAERFVKSIGNNTPVLPLSGGHDSRLIACILKKYGYHNTICFTYGRKTAEVDISQKVADLLGFRWYFINYESFSDEALEIDNETFKNYYRFASNLTSMFYLQEYPAVLYLLKHGIIPSNSIFLPGHSGDLLGGSQFFKVFSPRLKHTDIVNRIISSKFINYTMSERHLKLFRERIKQNLGQTQGFLAYSIFEDWDIREKIAKFIINSSRVFVFFGFQVRLFYWDEELIDFFRRLPPEFKNWKRTYNQCLSTMYFLPYSLNFKKELSPSAVKLLMHRIKQKIKPVFPQFIKKKYIQKNDWACYDKLTRNMLCQIEPSIGLKLPYAGYNSVIINWYLQRFIKDFEKK